MDLDEVRQIMNAISHVQIGGDAAELYFRDGSMRILVGRNYDEFMRYYDYLSWAWRVNPHDPESVTLKEYEKWKMEHGN